MLWNEIRNKYPNQWLVAEAVSAHTSPEGKRVLDDLRIANYCKTGTEAFNMYRKNHKENPEREYYYLHTSRGELDIVEEQWLGIRSPVEHNV
jgi:hypothetical protein